MKQFLFCIFVAMSGFLISCGNSAICMIDNPTDAEITVAVDGKAIVLAPMEFKRLDEISLGEHKMSVNGGAEKPFTVEGACLINPTGQEYIVWAEEYSVSGNSAIHLTNDTVMVDGEAYEGAFEVRTGNPIQVSDINYSIDKEFPEESEIAGPENYVIRRKLFRKEDFKKQFEK